MIARCCQAVRINEGRLGVGVECIDRRSGCHDRSNRQHGLIHAKGRRIVGNLRHGRGRCQRRQGVDLVRSHCLSHCLSRVAESTHLCVHGGSHVRGKLPGHGWNRSKVAAWDSVGLIWLRNSIHGRARFESDRSNRRRRNGRKGRERLIRLMTRGRRRMTRSKMHVGRNFSVPGIQEHDRSRSRSREGDKVDWVRSGCLVFEKENKTCLREMVPMRQLVSSERCET